MQSSSSALPLPAAPSPGLRLPLCLPVTYRGARRSGFGRSTKPGTGLHTNSLSHTHPGLQGTARGGAGVSGESGCWSCWGDHRNYSFLSHSAPLTHRADFRGETQNPTWRTPVSLPVTFARTPPPPKKKGGHGVEEANANPAPAPERQPIKGSKTRVRVLPGVGRDRPETPRTDPKEGGWED